MIYRKYFAHEKNSTKNVIYCTSLQNIARASANALEAKPSLTKLFQKNCYLNFKTNQPYPSMH